MDDREDPEGAFGVWRARQFDDVNSSCNWSVKKRLK